MPSPRLRLASQHLWPDRTDVAAAFAISDTAGRAMQHNLEQALLAESDRGADAATLATLFGIPLRQIGPLLADARRTTPQSCSLH